MPARDGTGPLGQGSRTGRGMGNCTPDRNGSPSAGFSGSNKRIGWGGRMWDATLGRFFKRRRANRSNRK